MNGAESLIRTLIAGGIDTCFTKSRHFGMHIVAALDQRPEMRCVLGLFEGVVTAAADGYARMAGNPPARCFILAQVSAMAWLTCTTPGGRMFLSSILSASMRPTTCVMTRR